MKLLTLTLALTASTALATSSILFKNYCNEDIFLTLNSDDKGARNLSSGAAYATNIAGQGNTALVTKNNDPYNSATPKLVLGTSTDQGVLYWSLSSQDGDPFVGEHFNVTSGGEDATGVYIPDLCQNATTYDGRVHSCQDSGRVVLAVFGCPFNALP